MIRMPIPELTSERRGELAKLAHKYAEHGARRRAQRAPRRHGSAEEGREGPQDLAGRARQKSDEVQKLTDRYVKQVDEALATQGKRDQEV